MPSSPRPSPRYEDRCVLICGWRDTVFTAGLRTAPDAEPKKSEQNKVSSVKTSASLVAWFSHDFKFFGRIFDAILELCKLLLQIRYQVGRCPLEAVF